MKILGLTFRVDELSEEARDFAGTLDLELLSSVLPGLVGDLGYRPQEDAQVSGQVYRSAQREVIVVGKMATTVGFDCVRCLSSRRLNLVIEGSHTLLKRATPKDSSQEIVVSDDDEDDGALYYSGDEVNLTDLYREELILALPMNPTCESVDGDECANDTLTFSDQGDVVDPRWAPLLELKKKLK